jgi:hypothetical protein
MIVGYSGFVIVARTGDMRLDDLVCIDDLFVTVTDDVRAGGWRIGFLGPVDDISPEDLAKDLARETASPAIALSVFDSDCAFAAAADPCGGVVEFYLNEKIVEAIAEGEGIFEPLNSQAIAGLLAWAETAGLVVDPDQLASALETSPGPFGDGISAFTKALGITELRD